MNVINKINVLVDNDSWILPYAEQLVAVCSGMGLEVNFARDQHQIAYCDVSFFIGCIQLVSSANLKKSALNLVVHESALPQGKGFAPVAWQILEGKHDIPICLIEATENADSGDIWLQDSFFLTGQELYQEWRAKQGKATLDLCVKFLKNYQSITPIKQQGGESFYARRTPRDSELSLDKTLGQQFDLLRTVDNENFPAFFHFRGKTYKLEISEYES
ncbi:methionyl-tRNA formyltransferase [Vibrio mimicus]|uniref:methionyl-tRNA formyltransferase n=1 Tax=Vibrio mimicus TaxID=674 RepID=UPI0011DB5059|nr:methionyl-tRNA formyltransferase [Vibrio mimicus]TXZ77087.1 methionyl-tRNA formyltransferase [Vibrio mimicus]BCN22676.1 putative monosaccharide biosynthesis protein [Vibrio mimicus]